MPSTTTSFACRRDGKTVYYALDDDHVRSILSMGMDHIEE